MNGGIDWAAEGDDLDHDGEAQWAAWVAATDREWMLADDPDWVEVPA